MGALSAVSERVHLWSPVLVKELRTRMRGARPAWLQAGYVFAMLVVMGIAYAVMAGRAPGGPSPMGFQLGMSLYRALFVVQAILVALMVPGFTAGAVSGEHEQKTYEMLACTRMRSRQVVAGKLLSAWLFAALLLTTSLPLAALCLLFGGVSPAEMLWSYGLIALTALLLGSVGLWWSAVMPRTLASVIGAYASMGAFLAASACVAWIFWSPAAGPSPIPQPSIFAAVNPFSAIHYGATSVPLFGWSIPSGLAAAALLLLGTAVVSAAASQRLPLLGARRGIAVRALMLILFAATAMLVVGNCGQDLRAAPTAAHARTAGAYGFAVVLTVLMALAAVFAVGQVSRPLRGSFLGWLIGGLSPRRVLQPQVRSAFPFLVLLGLIGSGVILGGVLYFAPGTRGAVMLSFARLVGLTVAMLFGVSMLGLWFALALPGVRGRVVLAVGLIVLYVVTLMIVIQAVSGSHPASSELVYLNPALIAVCYADPVPKPLQHLSALGPGLDAGMASGAAYVLVGFLGLVGARRAFRHMTAGKGKMNGE